MRCGYGCYRVNWSDKDHKIVIKPGRNSKKITPFFGLGDAIIRFNIDSPPEKIVKRLTGETRAGALLPPNPFKLRRWEFSPGDVDSDTIKIVGYHGKEFDLHFKRAGKFVGYEYASETSIEKNGFGVRSVYGNNRLES